MEKHAVAIILIHTSGGTRAGMATNSRLGSPISFLDRFEIIRALGSHHQTSVTVLLKLITPPGQPQEGLLEVVVGLGRNVIILKVIN